MDSEVQAITRDRGTRTEGREDRSEEAEAVLIQAHSTVGPILVFVLAAFYGFRSIKNPIGEAHGPAHSGSRKVADNMIM